MADPHDLRRFVDAQDERGTYARAVSELRAKGVQVETRPEWDDTEYGRFARIHDPEGNPSELWEPPPASKPD